MTRLARTQFTDANERTESLRRGSVREFDSGWFQVTSDSTNPNYPDEKRRLRHNLGRVPLAIDVERSKQEDGSTAEDGNSDVTVVKDGTFVTVENTSGGSLFFRVRAR